MGARLPCAPRGGGRGSGHAQPFAALRSARDGSSPLPLPPHGRWGRRLAALAGLRGIKAAPRSALDALERGNAFARARDHDAALHAYADAAQRGGAAIAAEARLLAGIALRRSDEHEAALLALREAAFLAPQMWHAWWALAALYAGLGLSARSAAASERAHAILLHGAPMPLASDVSGLAGLDLSAEHAAAWLQERRSRVDASTRRG